MCLMRCHKQVIFFCRMPSDGNTVKCGNPQCPFVESHLSCLAVSTPLPKGWYCPHCCRLPRFKRLRKVKKNPSEKMGRRYLLTGFVFANQCHNNLTNYLSATAKIVKVNFFFNCTNCVYNTFNELVTRGTLRGNSTPMTN